MTSEYTLFKVTNKKSSTQADLEQKSFSFVRHRHTPDRKGFKGNMFLGDNDQSISPKRGLFDVEPKKEEVWQNDDSTSTERLTTVRTGSAFLLNS